MKQLKRNKRKFWYSKYLGKTAITDENGNLTGESTVSYSEPVECEGNVSFPTGFANVEKFGLIVSYDILITLEDPDTPIDESTVLWVYNRDPETEPFDFEVRRVARSLNSATLQCAEAKVTRNG